MKQLLLISSSSAILSTNSASTENTVGCPTLTCDTEMLNNLCYKHSGTNPVDYILMSECPADSICDVGGIESFKSEYAFISSQYQVHESSSDPYKSQIFGKKTEAYCKNIKSLEGNLNNER
jgi:hypothetical protein